MRNLGTIFRWELASYYRSAIGYIFMIVFLLLSVGLFMTPFFTLLVADMRSFFNTLPLIMCIFLPAVTMRIWAEERKQNTWELLLTFPMRPHELVLGKFFAGLVFFIIALAGTLTIPWMLAWLGNPDFGTIAGAYLGAILLGAFFLALGLFVSSLCSDQIVAFVVTLLACFGLFFLGTEFLARFVDSAWPGLGVFLADVVGFTGHYNPFTRGIVTIGNILYFLIWTAVFLFLNGLLLEIRSRPAARRTFAGAVVLSLGIGLAFNWIFAGQHIGRFDLTADKLYTLSNASVNILRDLDVPVQVKLYITPSDKMPTEMRYLERDVLDKLEEMRLAGGGNLVMRTIHMETANVIQQQEPGDMPPEPEDEEGAVERRLLSKGVRPFTVQALREDEVINKLVYAAIGVAYKNQEEEIIPRLLPNDLDNLEYRLINIVYKMSRRQQPVIALFAPKQAVSIPPELAELYRRMNRPIPESDDPYETLERVLQAERYDVRRLDTDGSATIAPEVDTVVVINPRTLSGRERWDLNRALHEGKSVLLAVQNYRWDYHVEQQVVAMTRQDENPQVNEWLSHYGLEIDPQILMDVNHGPLTIRGGSTALGGGITLNLPMHILLTQESMNTNVSITSRLSPLFYLWGSALDLRGDALQENGLESTVLLTSSPQAWALDQDVSITPDTIQRPDVRGQRFPLAVLVRGQFPDVYAGVERPAWEPPPAQPGAPAPTPPDDTPLGDPQPAPGRLMVVGNAQMFHRNFFSGGHGDFFLNSVDALTLGDDLVNVRSKKRINRSISKPSTAERQFWRLMNLGLVNLGIAVVGVGGAMIRRRARAAYTAAQTA
ncbi:MAG: Gldg family protein [Candidatus Tectomicrobia bacterium]|nr:Gldg family protein [Candidatus Tectomicrobia bacterium]